MTKKSTDVDMPTLPWRKTRNSAPPKQPLGQDLIVETAIRILDAEGLEGVSMRRVAQELGTGPASLYAHVSNKDELLELMLERIAGEIELPEELDPARWQEQLKEIARNSQRVWTSHADIAKVSLTNIPTGPNLLRIAEAMLTLMRGAGVPDQVAAWALDWLSMYIDADAIEASMYTAKLKRGFDLESYFAGIKDYFRRLPPERFPNISSIVDSLTAGDGDERFEFGLDVFIRGLASYVEK
ncbi:MAG: putative TetR family transcriptional regulator [Actinomycetia bacterium]|nr:putative TetR family transcriptional regulator [Actinomycetes bacterium]